MEHSVYQMGDLVRITATFRDSAGARLDPTVVTLKVRDPDDFESTCTPTRDSTGVYHFDQSASAEGLWHYRWASTGIGQAADEGTFTVEESAF